jgi:hypothetical protein
MDDAKVRKQQWFVERRNAWKPRIEKHTERRRQTRRVRMRTRNRHRYVWCPGRIRIYICREPGPCLTTDQQYTVLLLQINPNTPTAMAILLRRSTGPATRQLLPRRHCRRHGLFLPMEFLRPCCFLAFLVVHVRLHMARPRQCPRAIPCLTNSSSLGAVSRFHVGAASMLACQIIYVVANGQQVWRAKRRTGTN